MGEMAMPGLILLGQGESVGAGIGFGLLCVSISAYYISVEWRKARQAQIEADLKREMLQKGMPASEIERVLKASGPVP
jgi:hypothetical protein